MIKKAYSYIRFSSKRQERGDSLRRQLKNTVKWCEKNDYELQDLSFQDLGVSGFDGKNTTDGNLGLFKAMVENGTIPKNPTLIVESLDRLSRESVYKSFSRLSELIDAGISIVTIIDEQTYHSGMDLGSMVISLSIMHRAHDESVHKSKRSKDAWDNKKEMAKQGFPVSDIAPIWITLENGKFILNEKAQDIQEIYRLYIDEHLGYDAIMKRLSRRYSKAFVQRHLANRQVLGEIQFLKYWKPRALKENETYTEAEEQEIEANKKKKVNDGAPFYYFPAVISEETFYRARAIAGEKVHLAGRRGAYTNLFTGITRCPLCGAPCVTAYKTGRKGKKFKYLICQNVRGALKERTVICQYRAFPVNDLENSFLSVFRELTLDDVISDDTAKQNKRKTIEHKIQAIKGEIAEERQKFDNSDIALKTTTNKMVIGRLATNMESAANKISELEIQIQQYESKYKTLLLEDATTDKSLLELQSLMEKMGDPSIRAQVKNAIRSIVKEINLYPWGLYDSDLVVTPEGLKVQQHPLVGKIEELKAIGLNGEYRYYGLPDDPTPKQIQAKEQELISDAQSELDAWNKQFKHGKHRERLYEIIFHNGNTRMVSVSRGILGEVDEYTLDFGDGFKMERNKDYEFILSGDGYLFNAELIYRAL